MILLLRCEAERKAPIRVVVVPGTDSSRISVLFLLCHPDASRSFMPGDFPSPCASPEVGPACRIALAFLLDPTLVVSTIVAGSHFSPDLAIAGGQQRSEEEGGGGLRRERREATPCPVLDKQSPEPFDKWSPLFYPWSCFRHHMGQTKGP